MSLIKRVALDFRGDERGSLTVIEAQKTLPFDIKRVYYLTGTKEGVSRGFHAHRDLEQLAVCVSGQCRLLLDDGKTKEDIVLDSPDKAIHITGMLWREMHDFSPDCVLLVLASEYYDESDYIRDYSEFLQLVQAS